MERISLLEKLGLSGPWLALATIGCLGFIIWITMGVSAKTKIGRKLFPIQQMMVACMLLSNLYILPGPKYSVYSSINTVGLPISLALLLFSCNIRALAKMLGKKPFIIMVAGSLASFVVGLTVTFLCGKSAGIEGTKGLVGVIATTIGGTENYYAVTSMFNIDPTMQAAVRVITAIGNAMVVALNTTVASSASFRQMIERWTKPTYSSIENIESFKSLEKVHVPATKFNNDSLTFMVMLALIVAALTKWGAGFIPAINLPGGGVITIDSTIVLTTVCLVIAAYGGKLIDIEHIQHVGMMVMNFVLASMFVKIDVTALKSAINLVLPVLLMYFFEWAVMTFVFAKIMRVDSLTTAISSMANVGGTGSAPVIPVVAEQPDLVPVAVAMASICGGVANYGGWIAGEILLGTIWGVTF